MLREHEQVVLTESAVGDDGEKLKPGDVGCVVHVHPDGVAAVVEFMSLDGETAVVATVLATSRTPGGTWRPAARLKVANVNVDAARLRQI